LDGTACWTRIVQPIEQADDGLLDVEGSFDFDGTEDAMHYSSLGLNGNLTPMASTEASSTARLTRTERLAGLGWNSR
jgi:hypothetical protein